MTAFERLSDWLHPVPGFEHAAWSRLLQRLSPKPRIFWYPSGGVDTRPFSFIAEPSYRRWQAKGLYAPRPDLFVYTCLGIEESDSLKASLYPHLPLAWFADHQQVQDRTRITIGPRTLLRINRNLVQYNINPDFVHFAEDPLKIGANHDAWFAEVTFSSRNPDLTEKWPLLYLKMENNNFLHSVLVGLSPFELTHLCAVREGCGMGGCGRSVIDTIYHEHHPDLLRSSGLSPEVVIAFKDYTRGVFLRGVCSAPGVSIHNSWPFFDEGVAYVLRYTPQPRDLGPWIPQHLPMAGGYEAQRPPCA